MKTIDELGFTNVNTTSDAKRSEHGKNEYLFNKEVTRLYRLEEYVAQQILNERQRIIIDKRNFDMTVEHLSEDWWRNANELKRTIRNVKLDDLRAVDLNNNSKYDTEPVAIFYSQGQYIKMKKGDDGGVFVISIHALT
jgi:hypothetical protein